MSTELDPQEKSFRKRKDIIKNIAIIFLIIMLVLTFFSNTIMNYSLPQVAVQYVQSGSITSKIRGTGTVTSGDPYNVMVKQSRTVASIHVKKGSVVEKGDLLLKLAEEDSEELGAAKEKLAAAQKTYDDLLLSDRVSAASIASSNGVINVDNFRNQITLAQAEVDSAQKNYDDISKQFKYSQLNEVSIEQKQNVERLQGIYEDAQTNRAVFEANKLSAENALSMAEGTREQILTLDAQISQQSANVTELLNNGASQETLDEANLKLGELLLEKSAMPTIEDIDATIEKARVTLGEAINAFNAANDAFNIAKLEYENAKNELEQNSSNITQNNKNLEIALADAEEKLKEKQDLLSSLISDISIIRELDENRKNIAEAKEDIEKLSSQMAGVDVVAPISGTVISVNVESGKTANTVDPVVVLQPEGQGYYMSFTVENDLAKMISVGDEAEVANSWWYNDVRGVIASIKPDTTAPQKNKLVTLDLQGDLVEGQTLTMSIASRTTNYDMIVPNSALHEDNNGKFILIVESKPSPLGNRYFAVRIDVEVLASDDTQTAVSGGFDGYEYVITTSTKPISAGDQVRLSES